MAAGEGAPCPFQGILLHATVRTGTEIRRRTHSGFFPLRFHPLWVQLRMLSIVRKSNSVVKSLKEEKRRRELVKSSLSEAHPALSRRARALLR